MIRAGFVWEPMGVRGRRAVGRGEGRQHTAYGASCGREGWWARGRARVVPEGGQHTRCVRRAAAGGAPAFSSFKKYAFEAVISQRTCAQG